MRKFLFIFLLYFIVTYVSTFTIKAMEKNRKPVLHDTNFCSIILPHKNPETTSPAGYYGLGGNNYMKNSVVNSFSVSYYRICEREGYVNILAADSCKPFKISNKTDFVVSEGIRNFETQLESQFDSNLTLHGVSRGAITIILWLAQLQKKQERIKCVTLEGVLDLEKSENSAINHTVENKNNMILNKIPYLPFARFWLPRCMKIFSSPTYNPLGKYVLSSAKKLPKIPMVIMHAIKDPDVSINNARKLYIELFKHGNKNAYLIEVPANTHFNVLDACDPDKQKNVGISTEYFSYIDYLEKDRIIKAFQAIYRKHNLPYNSNILRQDKEICLDKFQPSIDDVKERIKRTGRWGRILKNCIDFTTGGILLVVILTKIISKFR